jgi:hypothetical protein
MTTAEILEQVTAWEKVAAAAKEALETIREANAEAEKAIVLAQQLSRAGLRWPLPKKLGTG